MIADKKYKLNFKWDEQTPAFGYSRILKCKVSSKLSLQITEEYIVEENCYHYNGFLLNNNDNTELDSCGGREFDTAKKDTEKLALKLFSGILEEV